MAEMSALEFMQKKTKLKQDALELLNVATSRKSVLKQLEVSSDKLNAKELNQLDEQPSTTLSKLRAADSNLMLEESRSASWASSRDKVISSMASVRKARSLAEDILKVVSFMLEKKR